MQVSSTVQINCFDVYFVTTYYDFNLKMISLKHIAQLRCFKKIIKLKF